jgi:hypothetical protein
MWEITTKAWSKSRQDKIILIHYHVIEKLQNYMDIKYSKTSLTLNDRLSVVDSFAYVYCIYIITFFNIHLWLEKYNGFTRGAKVKIEKKKFYYYLHQCC